MFVSIIFLYVTHRQKLGDTKTYDEYFILQRDGFLDVCYDYICENGLTYSGCVICKMEIPDSTRVCSRCNKNNTKIQIEREIPKEISVNIPEYLPSTNYHKNIGQLLPINPYPNPYVSPGMNNPYVKSYLNPYPSPPINTSQCSNPITISDFGNLFEGTNITKIKGELVFIPDGFPMSYFPVFNMGNHISYYGKFDYDGESPCPSPINDTKQQTDTSQQTDTPQTRYNTLQEYDYEDDGVYSFNESEFPCL